jgi:hypothetical protein
VFANQALEDVRKGRLAVAPELRSELEDNLEVAAALPPGHSHRKAALERAAGIAQFAKTEQVKNEPMVRITQTTTFQKPDGSWWVRETDARGKFRETAIEGGKAPSEIYESEEVTADEIDFATITRDQAKRLSPTAWMNLRDENPELAESLLREASQAAAEKHAELRSIGAL